MATAHEMESAPSAAEAKSGREALYLALVAVGLVLGGGMLWFTNGARAFGELMTGAFYLCF